ncbi:MAG: TraR/DksA C4-type zinc finger protein [Rhodovibrionaceae bacterium]
MSERRDIDLPKLKARLEERHTELRKLIEGSKESRGVVELDQTRQGRLSRIDALQGQAMAQEAERRRQGELKRIDAALGRIASGDYGYCLSCDEEIAAKRLEFDPSVSLCVDCTAESGG